MRTVQEGAWGRSLTGGLGIRQIVFEGESDGSGDDGGEQQQSEPHSARHISLLRHESTEGVFP